MKSDAKRVWNELLVFVPADLYSYFQFFKGIGNRNELKQKESTVAKVEPSNVS